VPHGDPTDGGQEPRRRRVEVRGDAFAPRRRAQPREVDHVRALAQLARTGQRGGRVVRVDRVPQHRLRELEQGVDRLGVAVRRPDHRRDVGDDERVDDRLQAADVLLAHGELDRSRARRPGGGPRARRRRDRRRASIVVRLGSIAQTTVRLPW
jgi:hypothetical protein